MSGLKGGGGVKVRGQGRGQGWVKVGGELRSGGSRKGIVVGGSRGWSQGGQV